MLVVITLTTTFLSWKYHPFGITVCSLSCQNPSHSAAGRDRNHGGQHWRDEMKTKLSSMILVIGLLVAVPAFAGKVGVMSTPSLSSPGATPSTIDITVTAGATGAPAGFSLQWMSLADFNANGGVWPAYNDDDSNPNFCKASFSGNANGTKYNLGANQSVTVTVGDVLFDDPGASSNCANVPLRCATVYVFRAFVHANSNLNRSAWSALLQVSTQACSGSSGCTYTQGYWKTHGPVPTGNNTDVWPVNSITLGTVLYADVEMQSIFDQPAAGNGLISLAHQLMAAKLNIANGADGTAVTSAINDADALIGNRVVPPVGSGYLSSGSTSALINTLTAYNEGSIGPGHCE